MTKVLALLLMAQLLMTDGITAYQGHVPAGNQVATPRILIFSPNDEHWWFFEPFWLVTAISKMDGIAAVPPPSWTQSPCYKWSPCYECNLIGGWCLN